MTTMQFEFEVPKTFDCPVNQVIIRISTQETFKTSISRLEI